MRYSIRECASGTLLCCVNAPTTPRVGEILVIHSEVRGMPFKDKYIVRQVRHNIHEDSYSVDILVELVKDNNYNDATPEGISKLHISRIAYDLYKHDWIDEHMTSEQYLTTLRQYYIYASECQCADEEPLGFEDWVFFNGSNHQLFASYDEFCSNEYLLTDYIEDLLMDSSLINQYRKDRLINSEGELD